MWAPPASGGALAALELHIHAANGSYAGAPAARAHALAVRGWAAAFAGAPARVLVDGAPVPEGAGTPGWQITSQPAGAPSLTDPDGCLTVRMRALPRAAASTVRVEFAV